MPLDEGGIRTKLERLRIEVAEDSAAVHRRAEQLQEALVGWDEQDADEPFLVYVAATIHAYYTGLETLFERVARQVDDEVPGGPRWHQTLLSQATTEVSGLRPAVVRRSALTELTALLSFRHFFRHAYAVAWDAARVKLEAERVDRVHAAVGTDLKRFLAFIDSALGALPK